jgi:hypothetical protein
MAAKLEAMAAKLEAIADFGWAAMVARLCRLAVMAVLGLGCYGLVAG